LISTKQIEVELDNLTVVLNDLKVALAAMCEDEGDYLQQISGVLSDIIQADNECCDLLAGKLEILKTTITNNVNICGEITTTTTIALCDLFGTIECDGTEVIITMVAGDDISNILDVYWWNGAMYVLLDNVSKTALQSGYTITTPPATTRYKVVDNLGDCNAEYVLDLDGECTTSTTEEPATTTTDEAGTTTTSTTELPVTTTTEFCFDVMINPGEGYMLGYSDISAAWACATQVSGDLYADTASFVDATYLNSTACGEVAPSGYYIIIGLGLWRYWNGVTFDASGFFACPAPPV